MRQKSRTSQARTFGPHVASYRLRRFQLFIVIAGEYPYPKIAARRACKGGADVEANCFASTAPHDAASMPKA